VQDFINNRRRRIGDENNLDDLEAFVNENLKYQEGVTRDGQLYAFGENFGDGSESSHFQLGLTSKKMMFKQRQ